MHRTPTDVQSQCAGVSREIRESSPVPIGRCPRNRTPVLVERTFEPYRFTLRPVRFKGFNQGRGHDVGEVIGIGAGPGRGLSVRRVQPVRWRARARSRGVGLALKIGLGAAVR